MSLPEPARFFPVTGSAPRMHAGLSRLGTDFGNGPADQRTFLEDREAEGYQRAKLQCAQWGPVVLQAPAVAERQREALQEIAGFIKDRFAEDCPELTAAGQHSNPPGNHWLNQLGHTAMTMQEDFTVMQRDGKGEDRATLVHVCFPSGWRPERIVGQSFRAIHTPVPDFAEDPRAARSMLESMIGRGPYVRFVWTVCADEHLDHHPERGTRERFDAHTRRAFLRVERQTTVPFTELDSSLFLIRTYLYSFESLDAEQRTTLASSLRAMPPAIARYKGLEGTLDHTLRLLENIA